MGKTLSWFKYLVTKPSRKYSSKKISLPTRWLILQYMRSVCLRAITTMTFDMISPTKNIDSIVFKKKYIYFFTLQYLMFIHSLWKVYLLDTVSCFTETLPLTFNRWVWKWKQPSRVSSCFILHSDNIWLITKRTPSLLLHCVIIHRTLFAVLL